MGEITYKSAAKLTQQPLQECWMPASFDGAYTPIRAQEVCVIT